MAFDLRGRLWVAENYTYAESGVNFATNLMDRIVILEDRDADGRSDLRTVFWDQAKILTSVEPAVDGVYVLCPPRLLFLADRNHDDRPDGPPEVLLDGFDTTTGNRHTFANGLKTGPDGWLWGRIGISSGARIGVPGSGAESRVEMRGGIWRYHPVRREFEAVCHGTTNPWGLDWNEVGEPFFINTVIGHLWHAIPGAHLQRMHGSDVMERAYWLMPQIADHYHFDTGAGWTKSRPSADGKAASGSDSLGGGHAHVGMMIYQGTNWPAEYRGGLFTLNLHGRRLNRERLERRGSGYVGRHEPDLMPIADPWFRGIELLEGPDGGVSIADWSDTGECHEHDGVHRSSGRIYKVTHGKPGRVAIPDFRTMATEDLAGLVTDVNEWTSRAALKVLRTRGTSPERWEVAAQLRSRFQREKGGPAALRILWALQAMGTVTPDWLLARTGDDDEHVRSWAVRLLAEHFRMGSGATDLGAEVAAKVVERFEKMGRAEASAHVRLHLASVLQRLPMDARVQVARALVGRGEDAVDPAIPWLLWYGIEPLAALAPERLAGLAEASRIPMVRRFVMRRLGEELEGRPAWTERLLAWGKGLDVSVKEDLLIGLRDALRGVRQARMPQGWPGFAAAVRESGRADLQAVLRELEAVFGDGRAVEELKALALDGGGDPLARRSALRALVLGKADGVGPILRRLADDGSLRVSALTGLIEIGGEGVSDVVLARYGWLGLEERPEVLTAMAGRVPTAKALLEAVQAGRVRRADVTAFQAGQMARLGDPAVTELLGKVWGTLRAPAPERRAEIVRWKERLTVAELAKANRGRGRAVYQQLCSGCHRLYGEGGEVGPDLTGSGRSNLDYLLENVVDPGAVVASEQRLTVVEMRDGRTVSGLLQEATERSVTVVGPGMREVVVRSEIAKMETLEQSVMPEGLLGSVPEESVRDLVGYLMHAVQVPLESARPR
jgi:putative membrane-bound dehydrogenase-like protein